MARHVVVVLLLASCASGARHASLDVRFASASDGAASTRVVVGLHRDTTCGDAAYWSTVVARDGASATPPSIGSLAVGASAVALDASCRVVAEACARVDPGVMAVELVLVSTDRACVGAECDGCATDASVPSDGARDASASTDASVVSDAGSPSDAGVDLGVDACRARELCANGVDDDCDGFVDCDDDDCVAAVACTGCTMTPCP